MLDQLQTLVRQIAHTEVMPHFLAAETSIKQDGSILSTADLATQAALVRGLRQIIDCPVLGEEMTEQEQRDLWFHNYDGLWVVDPIDGTTNFIHNLPPHAISIGLLRNNDLVLGVVIEITRCELFYTWENAPSYLNGTVIHVSDAQTHNEALVATGFPYYDFGLIENYLNTMRFLMTNTRGIRRLGSAAIDLCYVACGRFDAFWEYGLHPWDMAAGALIIRNAGGKVCAFDKSDNYLFTGKIIATNANYFEEFSNTIVKYQHQ